MFLRISNLVRKEFVQFRRDWLMATFILALPVLQLVLLAQATGSRISDLAIAVLDGDRSRASRELVTALANRRELTVRCSPQSLKDARRLLQGGEVYAVVVVPASFGADLSDPGDSPQIQVVVDGSSTVPASTVLSAVEAVASEFALDVLEEVGEEAGASTLDLRTTVRFNPQFNHKFFTVPAQVGFIVYQVTLAIASIGLARERELGTLEQLLVMPLRRFELVVGKAIPALVIGAINFVAMLAVAVLAFGVPLRGSLALLLGLTLVFIVTEISYAMLISTVARTQQQAILLVFVLAMIDMAFSGYLVRVKSLPGALRIIAQVVPLSHYLTALRAVMLKGAGLDVLWPHAAAMLALGVAVGVLAVSGLSRRLD